MGKSWVGRHRKRGQDKEGGEGKERKKGRIERNTFILVSQVQLEVYKEGSEFIEEIVVKFKERTPVVCKDHSSVIQNIFITYSVVVVGQCFQV